MKTLFKITLCFLMYATNHASAPAASTPNAVLEQKIMNSKERTDFAALMHHKRTANIYTDNAAGKKIDYQMDDLFPVPLIPILTKTKILQFLPMHMQTKLWARSLKPGDLKESTSQVHCVSFSKDGKRFITIGGIPRVWDAATGQKITEISDGHQIFSISADTQGTKLATQDYTGRARIWDIPTNRLLHNLGEPQGLFGSWARDIKFSADDETVVTIDENAAIKRWNTKYGLLMQELNFDLPSLYFARLNPDGSKALVTSRTTISYVEAPDAVSCFDTPCIIDTATAKVLHKLPAVGANAITSATFSADSTLLITKEEPQYAKIWDTATGKLLKQISEMHRNKETINSDGTLMLKSLPVSYRNFKQRQLIWDQKIQVIDIATSEPIYLLPNVYQHIKNLAISPDNTSILVSTSGCTKLLKPHADLTSRKQSWQNANLAVEQIMLVWLIEQYHPKLLKHNHAQKNKVLKLISYFLRLDHEHLKDIFKSFSPKQQKDLYELYAIKP